MTAYRFVPLSINGKCNTNQLLMQLQQIRRQLPTTRYLTRAHLLFNIGRLLCAIMPVYSDHSAEEIIWPTQFGTYKI